MSEIRTLSSRYRVEPDLRIGWTSPNWDRFAIENGAPELTGGAVVGRPLLDFIEGAETRALYDSMLKRVRDSGTEVHLPFRCDSPDRRRFMSLHISRADDAKVVLTAELLREEPRPSVSLLARDSPRVGDPIRICSFCKRVESRSGAWQEVEEVELELESAEEPLTPPLAHDVCPECRSAAENAMAGEKRNGE